MNNTPNYIILPYKFQITSIKPYNDSFDIVQKADGTRFFVDKRAIDAIATAISGFTGTSAQ